MTFEAKGAGVVGATAVDTIVRSGIIGSIIMHQNVSPTTPVSALIFRKQEFGDFEHVDPSGQILASILRNLESQGRRQFEVATNGIDDSIEEVASEYDEDPILVEFEGAIEKIRERRSRLASFTSIELESIQKEIDWISDRLGAGRIVQVENALIDLIRRQSNGSQIEHLVKTISSVADRARKAREFEFAVRLLELIFYSNAVDAPAMSLRAEVLCDLGQFSEALAAYDAAIDRFPENAVARNGRAEVLRNLGQFSEALAAYDAAIDRFPENAVARNGRAEVLRDLGQFSEALAAYDAAIDRFPEDAFARTGQAEVLRDLGRFSEALAAYDAAIDRFPEDAVARNGRAEVLRDLGQFSEALAAYDAAIDRFPENAVARNGRAEVLRDLGQFSEALAAYDAA
uniref:tetratricopeptide repeat protein n=1 Tax=uncultured Pelagimonas sp. TaxID=1618102 RepID=UPI00261BBA94